MRVAPPAAEAPPLDQLEQLPAPSRALGLLAMLLVAAGILGWAVDLTLPVPSSSEGRLRTLGVAALVLATVGLLIGWWSRQRWQRASQAHGLATRRLNGFHAVMSQTNRLIVRRPTPGELFEEVCQCCVREGGVDLALVELSDAGRIRWPPDGAGEQERPAPVADLLPDSGGSQRHLAALAMGCGGCLVIHDVRTDDRIGALRSWCLAHGFRALAAIPLNRAGHSAGALLLHSKAPGFFGLNVCPLLSELGADLSFALDNADRERERQAALHSERDRITAEVANRAKTDFLAQMSHELRTPLNAMLGFAQLLATDDVDVLTPAQTGRVRLITQAGWHLLALLNDVMDISGIESGRFAVENVCADISSVLDEAVALSQPLARRHRVRLSECVAPPSGIVAMADHRRLHQVMLNLVSNACKYNRPGGRVRVEVTCSATEVHIDVLDNGVGMTDEQLTHLFEPYNRLGHEGRTIEGSGIGLTLTRQLVQMMNGRLEMRSHPDDGTRARVVLPACVMPPEPQATPFSTDRLSPPPATAGTLVLYIEDDPVNQILVEQMLSRRENTRLIQAGGGTEGVALALQRIPDLILLDMNLPDMTGLNVLSLLRADARTAALPVVAVSANAMPLDVAIALELGAVAYWTKPLKLESFLAGVAELLRRSGPAAMGSGAG